MLIAPTRHTRTPDHAARADDPAGPPAPPRAAPGSVGRVGGVAACLAATAWALAHEGLSDPARAPLFAFFCLLSLLAVLLPASGPRGRRVCLLPGVGLAAALLLPLPAALLPPLLAGTAEAFTRDPASARRAAYARGFWLALAAWAAGSVRAAPAPPPEAALALAALAYAGVYAGGRLLGLARHFRAARTVRRHAWAAWELEAVSLAACVPAALLMALSYPASGLGGAAGGAAGLALILVAGHLGFEASGLRAQVRAMEAMSAVTVAQTTAPDIIKQFLSLSCDLISCDRSSLWLVDDSQTRLDRVPDGAAPSPRAGAAASVRFGEGLVGRVAERRELKIVRDGARDPRLTREERLADRRRRKATEKATEGAEEEAAPPDGPAFSLLLLPLVAGDETLGVAQFERDAPGAFTARDAARVRALAGQTAATLANVRSHQSVYSQSITDGLTGLFNKRHVQAVLGEERRRALRYGHALSVVMLDVDGFKSYNDTYGHVQGDVLLKKMAALLRDGVRAVDVVGRYGGEEFIIVMPETLASEAFRIAERLRLSVARAVFPGFAHDPDLAVFKTISLGVAAFPDGTDDAHALVALADAALYRAKHGGRNQTVLAGAGE